MASSVRDVTNLLALQNLMKRDPKAYQEEFNQQLRHFHSSYHIFTEHAPTIAAGAATTDDTPAEAAAAAAAAATAGGEAGDGSSKPTGRPTKDFASLITFLAHVAPCFKDRPECVALPAQLIALLEQHAEKLDPPLRRTVVQSLIMLQNRSLIDRIHLLPTLFKLFRTHDKPLRALLFTHIVSDIRHVNAKGKNERVNSTLQNFMFAMLRDESLIAAKKSLEVMVELWRRKVWTDAKSVNAIASACFAKDTTMMVSALRFFLGIEQTSPEDEEDEKKEVNKGVAMKQLMIASSGMKGVKRKGKRQRDMKRAVAKIRAHEEQNNKGSLSSSDYPAIQLLYDPQQFAERLFSMLKRSGESFDVRQLMMNVISRLIGSHKLILLDFYPFVQKYIQAHQRNVTSILVYLAQGSHDLVPPDVLRPCVKTLADSFVNDRSSPEVMAVGINAIREVCARAPLVMSRELLHDLAQYRRSKFKGVMMASRSLIALFRDINPSLLVKRDRGKTGQMTVDKAGPEFGQSDTVEVDISGMELLLRDEAERKAAGEAIPDPTADDQWKEKKTEKKKKRFYGMKGEALLPGQSDDDSDGSDMEEISDGDDGDLPEIGLSDSDDDAKSQAGDGEGDGEVDEDGEEDDEEEEEEESKVESKAVAKKSGKVKAVPKKKNPWKGEREKKTKWEKFEEIDDDDSDDDQGEGFVPLEAVSENEDGEDEDEDDEKEGKKEKRVSKHERQKAVRGRGARTSQKELDKLATFTKLVSPTAASSSSSSSSSEAPPTDGSEAAKAAVWGTTKILTPRDLERIAELRAAEAKSGEVSRKRKRFDGAVAAAATAAAAATGSAPVDESDIVGYVKVSRKDKATRLASVEDGRRDEREYRKEGKAKKGGSTNQEKLRKKPFTMVQHKAHNKALNTSFNDRQKRQGAHIKKLKQLAVGKRNKKRRK